MQTAKHAAASAKASLNNTTAKTEEKLEKTKASTHEKLDKVMAHDKAGRKAAHERKEAAVAGAKQEKHEKKANNIAETAAMKTDIDRQHGAADMAAKTAHTTGATPVTYAPGANQPLNSAAPGATYGNAPLTSTGGNAPLASTGGNYGNAPLPSTGGNAPHTYGTAGAPAPTYTTPTNTTSGY